MTLGFFDGVHLGHAALLSHLKKLSLRTGLPSLVLTFDARPVFRSEALLTGIEERIALIKAQGVDEVVLEPFTEELAALSPETFLREVVCARLNARAVLAGYDCRFGKDRAGNIGTIRSMAGELGLVCEEEEPFRLDGRIVSSTLCRELLIKGDLEELSRALGRKWSLKGEIRPGRGVGKKLGFPTANLSLEGLASPPCGAYAASCDMEGRKGKALLYFGTRPTFGDSPEKVAEVFLPGCSGDLYGRKLVVTPERFLGPEKRYADTSELKAAIASFLKLLDA